MGQGVGTWGALACGEEGWEREDVQEGAKEPSSVSPGGWGRWALLGPRGSTDNVLHASRRQHGRDGSWC